LVGISVAAAVNTLLLRRSTCWPREQKRGQTKAWQQKITHNAIKQQGVAQQRGHHFITVETKKDGLRRPLIARVVATNYSE
jgi:hypothetical protein